METANHYLTDAPIGKLMMKFSIPCILSLLVSSLYNIVDQIFIGWGVGYLGNGATNVVFPITIIALAIALMIAVVFRKLDSENCNDGENIAENNICNAI